MKKHIFKISAVILGAIVAFLAGCKHPEEPMVKYGIPPFDNTEAQN